MAAWHRKGGFQHFEEKLINGMRQRGYSEEFAQQIYRQIQGFGEYGFPESHSASFALLVYISAWLKHHEHAAFTCALLNSQPMGFYAPAQLVQDAQRHGVEVRSVDALKSDWDCTLEERKDSSLAIRLGLRMVSGLSESGAQRLIHARGNFSSMEELVLAAKLSRRDLHALVAADSFASSTGHRHVATWLAAGVEPRPPLLQEAAIAELQPDLFPPTEGQEIVADYASTGLSLRRHPLALLRAQLRRMRMLSAEELSRAPAGRLVRVAGLVTCRQRPGTASGVVFITIEDEINVVVWGRLADKQRRPLIGARLLGVHGTLQREGQVAHLIAARLVDYSAMLGSLTVQSRDFH
jgi:error-prone DNA polymerase